MRLMLKNSEKEGCDARRCVRLFLGNFEQSRRCMENVKVPNEVCRKVVGSLGPCDGHQLRRSEIVVGSCEEEASARCQPLVCQHHLSSTRIESTRALVCGG